MSDQADRLGTRRHFLAVAGATACAFVAGAAISPRSAKGEATTQPTTAPAPPFRVHDWKRDAKNPVLPPAKTFDAGACMNPFVIRVGDEYYLFYSGATKGGGVHRICLATAPVADVRQWKRLGPLFEVGKKGAFDETWCVLPCVHKIGAKWHLYYTGRSAKKGAGLQAFWGMGLATSDDLLHWTKTSPDPLLTGDGFADWPNNRGIAGGGRIIELPQPDGKILYRMYYTLPTGTPSKSLLVDQAKQAVTADSYDGLKWFDKRVVLRPRLDARYENAATIALNVWKSKTRWRAIYAGIGSQFGAYSICEAASIDGLNWERGQTGENLSIPPSGKGWESRMTCYPNVIEENGKLRLFYCGNGYGATGIGTATAEMLD